MHELQMTMPTMQEIDEVERASIAAGDTVLPRLCAAARRGVEADAEVRRVERILSNDIRNLTEKVIPNIRARAEKAKAENKTLVAYKKHDQNTIEFLNNAITRKIAENEAALAEAVRREHALAKECVEAWESAVDWSGYASEYFQTKHGADKDMDKLNAARDRLTILESKGEHDEQR